jgi:hypothetical protein
MRPIKEQTKRLAGTGVTINALHPASLMPTKMILEAGWQKMSAVENGAKIRAI